MTDQPNSPDDQSDDRHPPENEESELRTISDEELDRILVEHKTWLITENRHGKRADLRNTDLSERDLQGVNLQKAQLNGASLIEAILTSANLQQAELHQADLTEATLIKTDLRGADLFDVIGLSEAVLDDCNMDGAIGLTGDDFARASVIGAKLPADLTKWEVLEVVAETSKNARKIFMAMLLACVYSWLTIASTTDVKLLTNSASSPLPIIGTAIPIAWFYFAAPLLLLGLYLYQHFYLQRLWENLAGLPAIFEDGKRLDQRAYPWLLNGLVRRHFDKLRPNRTRLQKLEEWVSTFLAWWVVPLTLLWFWARYIPRHDWWVTGLQIGLFGAAVTIGFAFYTEHWRTLGGKHRLPSSIQGFLIRSAGCLALVFGLLILSHLAFTGDGLEQLGFSTRVDLSEATVSTRADNYWEIAASVRDSSVTGANLRGQHLRGADLRWAFFVKADLRHADLRHADGFSSNFSHARLNSSRLDSASLQAANLEGANFSGASLLGADLQGANFTGGDLKHADLRHASLISAVLDSASLIATIMDSAVMRRASLKGANLMGAYLRGAVLTGANLSNACLLGTDLTHADLAAVNLSGANMRSAKGLTQEQLDEACGDSHTLLPYGLTIKPCPQDSTANASMR